MKEFLSLCVRRPVTIIMIMAALLLGAVFSLGVLPLDRLPELSLPQVMVETLYPGMGAPDIRSLITIPLEDALSAVKGLQNLRSVSRDGSSLLRLDFRWGTDPSAASVLVREVIDAVYPALPEGIRKPTVIPADAGNEVHALIAVLPKNGDGAFARNLADYELRARIRRLDGTGTVVLAGGDTEEERVFLDVPGVLSRGLEPAGLIRLLSMETAELPAGTIREGGRELTVVSSARPESSGELSRLVLPAETGALRLGDAAELRREKGRRKSLFIAGGREAAALEVYRRSGADPLRFSRDIRKTLAETAPLFGGDAEIVLIHDASAGIVRGIGNLAISAALAAAAVILALLVFLKRLRYSILAALSIPLSAAAGICVLALAGKSLNNMSLGGLALGIGIVSDTSVIILDLLHRRFASGALRPPPSEISAAVASVSGSCFASTFTTAVVFLPVIFLPGPLGGLYGDLALSLVSSIGSGWLYAQFCLPPLYRLCFRPPGGEKRSLGIEKKYRPLLAKSLRAPRRTFAAAAAASLLGIFFLLLRPAVFVNPDEAEELELSLVFPPGTLMETIGEEGMKISRRVSDLPGIEKVFGGAGSEDDDPARRAGVDYRREELRFRCLLQKGADPEKVRDALNAAVSGMPPEETLVSVSFPRDRIETLLGLSASRTLALRGKDWKEVEEETRVLCEELRKRLGPRLGSLNPRPAGTRPELRFFPDREAAALLGISSYRIAENLYAVSEGRVAATLEIEGRPLDLRVLGKNKAPAGEPEAALEDIPLLGSRGMPVFTGSLGRIRRSESAAALARLDRSDVIYLDVFPAAGQGKAVSAELEKLSRRFRFSRADESVFIRYRGSLLLTLGLVLFLLYLSLGAQFESFTLPFILLLTVPFSLAGSGPLLFLSGLSPDSGTVLGLTALFGLSVNNAIVLYEISVEKRNRGVSPSAAVYSGALERLRPMLISTATTLFALLPLVISPLGNSQRSMALAMLGGMGFSLVFTLFALPPVFVRFLEREKPHG